MGIKLFSEGTYDFLLVIIVIRKNTADCKPLVRFLLG